MEGELIMFEIKKGVAIPTSIKGRPRKYPLAEMEIGDSFVVSCNGKVSCRKLQTSILCCYRLQRKKGKTLITRINKEYTEVCVWRIK